MEKIIGKGTSPGITIGKAYIHQQREWVIEDKSIDDIDLEKVKVKEALYKSVEQLNVIYKKMCMDKLPEADIFLAHKMILEDPDFLQHINEGIEQGKNARWAINRTANHYINIFQSMESDYFKERASDIYDLSKRLMGNIDGIYREGLAHIQEPCILVAKDLTPSDTVSMNREFLRGIITEKGGATSHTAILASSLSIPAITSVLQCTEQIDHKQELLIDGGTGVIYVEPKETIKKEYLIKQKAEASYEKLLKEYIGCPSVTEDGYSISLVCNIGQPEEADRVISNDGEGVGLFRTEFLFMGQKKAPSEEVQYKAYKTVCEAMDGKEVIIRTLDIGGDKDIPYLKIEGEMNPFLGLRGIRYCLHNETLFMTQIRALLRVNEIGNIKVMIPMISELEEVIAVKTLINKASLQLRKEGYAITRPLKLGMMVETPSAVLLASEFATKVDFFSIGTNDLIQYTCVADRMNNHVGHLYSAYQPAVLRSIRMVVEAAHNKGISVSICGEAASDPYLLPLWIQLEIDKLSVTPSKILDMRYRLKQLKKEECDNLDILSKTDKEAVQNYLHQEYGGNNCEPKEQL